MARKSRNVVNIEADIEQGAKAMGFVDGMMEEISTSRFIVPVVEYVHSRLAGEFDQFADLAAKGNYEHYGHVYETGMLGLPEGRLWRHTFSGRGENRQASWEFLPAKMPIPTPEERQEMNNSNDPLPEIDQEHIDRLSREEYVFTMKATVQEFNLPVNIQPVNAKALFVPMFGMPKGFRFLKSSGMQMKNLNSGKFTALWAGWWATEAPALFGKEIRRAIEKDLGKSEKEIGKVAGGRARKKQFTLSTVTDTRGAYENGRNYAEAYIQGKARGYRQAARYVDKWGKFGDMVSYPK